MLAQTSPSALPWLVLAGSFVLLFLLFMVFVATRYRKCPADKILVVFGMVGGGKSCRVQHGGGSFVMPLIQDYAFLSLDPIELAVDINASSSDGQPVLLTMDAIVAVSTAKPLMMNAVERLLHLSSDQIRLFADDLVRGAITGFIQDTPSSDLRGNSELTHPFDAPVVMELEKVGLAVISMSIRSIAVGGVCPTCRRPLSASC